MIRILFLLAAFGTMPLLAQSDILRDPSKATEIAPFEYRLLFSTTKGDFTVLVQRDWSPHGADRLYNLVKAGYFENIAFFRVIQGFMAQFGLHGDPDINKIWADNSFPDDPRAGISNDAGTLVFAKKGIPNSRSTQLYINLVDNPKLDQMDFTPLGRVEGDGMEVMRQIYSGYGEGRPRGMGPDQQLLKISGNAYLERDFPRLDYIISITLVD